MGAKRIKVIEGVELTGHVNCRKVRYPTQEAADALKGRLYAKNRRAKKGRRPIRSYFCIHCLGWHLGRVWNAGQKRKGSDWR